MSPTPKQKSRHIKVFKIATLVTLLLDIVLLLGFLILQIKTQPAIRRLGVLDYSLEQLRIKYLMIDSDVSLFKTPTNLLAAESNKNLVEYPEKTILIRNPQSQHEAQR